MNADDARNDRHFPLLAHDNPLRALLGDPGKFCSYVAQGQIVADLGCGPGFYTIPLAESVGPAGKVYAVDSDERAVRAVERKAAKRGLDNVEARASSAGDLGSIADESVDFILANGLLCSTAPRDHEAVVNEMRRILKPRGKAFLSVAKGSMSYVDASEWEEILSGFTVERRGDGSVLDDRWALVSRDV